MVPRDFTPPFWLRNPHVQTVFGRFTRPRQLVELRRETLETPDGDDLVLDHLDNGAAAPIHFILMHGLEGSSYSVYMQGILSLVRQRGLSATAINFRSCARDPQQLSQMLPNRRPRFYHSGETGDFDLVVRTLAARYPDSTFAAFGASLGGNVLLKWLGERPLQTSVAAAAALSTPYDLAAAAAHLEKSAAGRMYSSHFLATLREKVARVVEEFPETRAIVDLEATLRARSVRQFDDAATAPLHGFRDAADYYARSSSITFLPRIATPTLCVSSEDDPFLPVEVLPRAKAAAADSVEFVTTRCGGHVGFIEGDLPWRCAFWAEELIVDWLVTRTTDPEPRMAAAR